MLHNLNPLAILRSRLLGPAVIALMMLATATGLALAQGQILTVTHPGGLTTLLVENPIVVTWLDAALVTHFWEVPGCRFALMTGPTAPIGGNPTISGDENRYIASVPTTSVGPPPSTYTSFTSKLTISISGKYYDLHALGASAPDVTGSNPLWDYWPVPAVAGKRDVTAIGAVPIDDPDPTKATQFVRVQHGYTLIGDALRIEHIVTNTTTAPVPVGIRVLVDGCFGGGNNLDGQSLVLPDGRVIDTAAKLPDALTPKIPSTWLMFDNPSNPLVVVRGTLDGEEVHDPGAANETGGLPDEVAWGLFRDMGADAQWDFTPSKVEVLQDEDWAYSVKWQEKDLNPGVSRRYVTYYGLGASTSNYDPPYALMAYAPGSLVAHSSGTPSSGVTYTLTDSQGRSPFPVYAYADNFYAAPILDAAVRISLPAGLELDPVTQPQTLSLGTLKHNDLKSVSWTVRATAARPGIATVNFIGPDAKTVQRRINIPALPILTPLTSPLGIEMVSIPYTFSDTDAQHVFGSLGDLHAGGANALIRYNPGTSGYVWFPDPFVTNISPGNGYWLLNTTRAPVVLPTDAMPLPTDVAASVNVQAGWNQIGDPFTSSLFLNTVQVIGPSGQQLTLADAVDQGMLLPTLFWYDAANEEYAWNTEVGQTRMDPYYGYWVYCQDDVTLLFPPPNLLAPAAVKPAPRPAAPEKGAWTVALSVSGGGRVRGQRCFGESPTAKATVDAHDVLAPPTCMSTKGVQLSAELVRPSTGMRFMRDVRPAGGTQEWELDVTTSAAGQPITVAWPDLSAVPGDLSLTLQDLTTGERRYMRTTNSYVYRADATGGPRKFKITVQPRAGHVALVTTASVKPVAGGASFVYSLAADAAVDLQVRNLSGVVVRQVSSGKVCAAGVNTQPWDGRNTAGLRVPNGVYLCTITARSPETGEQHTLVRSFQLAR